MTASHGSPCDSTALILYSSKTWALTWALQDKVDTFDNVCLRRIFRVHGSRNQCHRTIPSRLTATADSQLIQTRRLWFFEQVATMDTSLDITRAALKVLIRGMPKDWRRPRHTWLRTLDADLHPHNFGLNSAWK